MKNSLTSVLPYITRALEAGMPVLTIGLALATLTGFVSASFFLNLFTHFRIQYIVLALLGFIIALILRKPLPALVFVLIAALNIAVIFPFVRFQDNEAAVEETTRIYFANTYYQNDNIEKIASSIEEADPDVAVLAEVMPGQRDALINALPEFSHRTFAEGTGTSTLLLLSRTPLSDTRIVPADPSRTSGSLRSPLIRTTLAESGLTLVALHPPVPLTGYGYEFQQKVFERAADIAQENDFSNTVIVGDFNATPWSANVQTLAHECNLIVAKRNFTDLPTWPTWLPFFSRIPIDLALGTSDVTFVRHFLGKSTGSDHLPIVVDVAAE